MAQEQKQMEKPQIDKKWSIFAGIANDGYKREDAESVQINAHYLGKIDQYKLQQKLQELGFASQPYSHAYMCYFVDDKKLKSQTTCIVGIGDDNSRDFQNTFNTLRIISRVLVNKNEGKEIALLMSSLMKK